MAITEFEYNPTNWNTNEAITPSKLNKIEQSLYKVGNILKEISKSLEDLDNKISSVKGDIAGEINAVVTDAKNETEKIIFNYDKTIASVIADYKDDMDNRFIALDDYKAEVISAGTAAADNFLIGKGVDLEDLKAWRVDKEAKDAERDLWQNGVDTWKGDTMIRIDNQDGRISGIDIIANEAKTTATAAANTATTAANTATTAANNIDSQIWAGNQNLTNSFKTLLNSDDARSIINNNAKIAIGRTFGMNISDGDDVETTNLQNNIKNAINKNAKIAIGRTFGMNPGDDDDIDTTSLQDNIKSTINKNARLTIGRTLGATSDDDEDIDTEVLKTSLKNVTKTNVSDLGFAKTTDIESKVTAATSGLLKIDDFNTKFDTRFGDKGVPSITDIDNKVALATTGLLKETDFDTKFNNKKVEIGKMTRKSLGTVLGASIDDSADDIPAEQLKTILNSTLQTTIGTAREGLATTTEVAAATIGLATKEEVQNEAAAREQAISNEATAREQAISNATTSLATKEEVQNEATAREQAIFNATASLATKEDVKNAGDESARQNRLMLGRAFGLKVDDKTDVDPVDLQSQLQTFTATSLFQADSLVVNTTQTTTTSDENGVMTIAETPTTENISLAQFIEMLRDDMVSIVNNNNENLTNIITKMNNSLNSLQQAITTINGNIQTINTLVIDHVNKTAANAHGTTEGNTSNNLTAATPTFGNIGAINQGTINVGGLGGIITSSNINNIK